MDFTKQRKDIKYFII